MNILDQLAEHARQRVEAAKQTLPLAEIKPLQSRGLPLSASVKKHRPPRGSSHRSSHICRSPENTKPLGQMPSRC